MADQSDKKAPASEDEVDESRREFLRTSVYAAYATPLITTLLVTEKAAAQSTGDCPYEWARELCRYARPGHDGYIWCQQNGCL